MAIAFRGRLLLIAGVDVRVLDNPIGGLCAQPHRSAGWRRSSTIRLAKTGLKR